MKSPYLCLLLSQMIEPEVKSMDVFRIMALFYSFMEDILCLMIFMFKIWVDQLQSTSRQDYGMTIYLS